jgi:hypothetical protein
LANADTISPASGNFLTASVPVAADAVSAFAKGRRPTYGWVAE